LIGTLLAVPRAGAAAPDFLLQAPESQALPGAGAGELDHPKGIAVDPGGGHVFIADRRNARISEYTAWGWFVKSWGWGVSDSTAELQTCGPAEPEGEPDPSLCQKGLTGTGKGQLALLAGGMAVDASGNVWVGDLENLRAQKFSPSGQFLLMLGGDVNKTKMEAGAPAAQRNLCPVDPGDVCQAGASGEGQSQLSGTIGDYIAYSPVENGILVGDKGGIQVFNLDGSFKKEIPFEGAMASFAGETVNALDIGKDGNIYFSLSDLEDVFKLDPTGVPIAPGKPGESKFEVGNPLGVAVDVEGTVYSIDDPPGESPIKEARVRAYSVAGAQLIPTSSEEGESKLFPYVLFPGPALTGIASNICVDSEPPGNLYLSFFREAAVSHVNAYGTPPIGCELPPPREPEVLEQFATSVGREEATVKAQINPLFWPNATYYVEYGTGKCSEGGCPNLAPVPSGVLTDKSINAPVMTAGVVLEDLEPQTTYHYRFVAESGGGGPVVGVDPDGREGPAEASEEEGLEATFKTARPAGTGPACPNDAVRIGESAKLPDCRAYEMVSPLDKGGGDVAMWDGRNAKFPQQFEIHQGAPHANRFTYTSAFSFAHANSAPFVSQYLADREVDGWSSVGISPPRTEASVEATRTFHNDFRGFSDNLCLGSMILYSVAPLAGGAVEKYPNVYVQDQCVRPSFIQSVSIVKPVHRLAEKYQLEVNGFTKDGSHVAFTANEQLDPDAPLLKQEQELLLYEYTEGAVRFVCYLPDESVLEKACSAGATAGSAGSAPTVRNSLSQDGSRTFFTLYDGTPGIGDQSGVPGQIYVRIDGTETKNVSTAVASAPAWYWIASDDGSKAIFEFASGPHKDELYELDVDTETPTLIAGEVEGPMGASEDASILYFASKEDLDDTGPASGGDHNLYLYEADPGGGGGEFTFIMKLSGEDVDGAMAQPAPVEEVPIRRSARVSPSGEHAAFVSAVSPTPTGFDNRDASSGEPAQQVYLYDAVSGELRCVSCNPSRARPVAESIGLVGDPYFAAARLQGWELLLHAPRVLTDDGTRVFFESFEALVPRDTNGTWDVYQWEEEGKGTCTDERETFNEDSGGCVNLISSGLSAAKSTFLDADPSGDNIFFSTQSSLVGQDYGLNDVYVARVGGGFPEPKQKTECEGEACQSPPPPPAEVTPSTETAAGPGNVPPVKPKQRRCPKGKRKVRRAGKVRCVKRKAKARANKTRRAPR
jgi:hypothetical protein